LTKILEKTLRDGEENAFQETSKDHPTRDRADFAYLGLISGGTAHNRLFGGRFVQSSGNIWRNGEEDAFWGTGTIRFGI
jgi:hypothetical protein